MSTMLHPAVAGPAEFAFVAPAVRVPRFLVRIDGEEAEVLETPSAVVARPIVKERVEVSVTCDVEVASAVVRPLRLGIVPEIDGRTLRFSLFELVGLSVEINGELDFPLILLAESPREAPAAAPRVIVLESGDHDGSALKLTDGSILFIGHGARVCGSLHLRGVKNVQILGTGIIDAVNANPEKNKTAILVDRCENVLIDGPLGFMCGQWGCIVRCSRHITIKNLKLIGHEKCSDGIDVDGSHHVRVSGCFIKNNDDCLCIKSSPLAGGSSVEDVEFSDCTLWNGPAGNGIELGYESQTHAFRDITFRNIDIIHVETEEGGGWIDRMAALSMHITHDAHVQNVLYENITIEDVQTPKIIQFTTFHYYRDHGWFSPADRLARGKISNVRLKNVHFLKALECRVHVEGFNGPDDIENMSFENVTMEGINLGEHPDLALEVINTKNFTIS